jgi:phage-related protein
MILMNTPGGGDLFWHCGTVEAQPLLKVFGNGTLSFLITRDMTPTGSVVETTTFSVANVSAHVVIDSETMTVYKASTNKLKDFTSSDGRFPRLSPYGNAFGWSNPGPVSKIEVTPNWRSL